MTGCFPVITETALSHAKGRNLLYIPTAAYGEGWEPDPVTDILPFEQAGFSVELFDLAGKTREETEKALDRSHVVFVSGGNTFHLLRHMRESGFYDIIAKHVEAGLVYSGSSAGAVVATPDIAYAASVDDPTLGGSHGTEGLGFVDRPILPHMDHPQFAPFVRRIAEDFEAGGVEYFGLADSEAMIVDGNGVRLVSAASTSTPAADNGFAGP